MLEEQMELDLKEKKELLDKSYDITKNKYGVDNAGRAVMLLFLDYKLIGFTRDDNARKNMEKFCNDGYYLYQILLDYAISSYIINKMECDIGIKDIDKYIDNVNSKLNYDDVDSVKVVALAAAYNICYAYNLLLINSKMREMLLYKFIDERYIQNKKELLDNSKKAILVKFKDKDKQFVMSKFAINRDFSIMRGQNSFKEAFKFSKIK